MSFHSLLHNFHNKFQSKMSRAVLTSAITLGSAMALAGTAAAGGHSKCGKVTIADMNWASASLMANVDAIILKEGYGCETEIIPGDTMPTFTSMNEKANPDVASELWINAVREPLAKAMSEGRLHSAVKGPITGLGEGWWVTEQFAKDHPDLNTVEKILERPDLFPYAEDKSKGAFMGCPAGWGCQLSNINMFRAFEMEKKGWVLVDPGSSAVQLDGAANCPTSTCSELSKWRRKVGSWLIQVHRLALMDQLPRHLNEVNRGSATTGRQRPSLASTTFKVFLLKLRSQVQTTGMDVSQKRSKNVQIQSPLLGQNLRSTQWSQMSLRRKVESLWIFSQSVFGLDP